MKIDLSWLFMTIATLILIFAWEVDWYWAIGIILLSHFNFTYETTYTTRRRY